jgi:hypothetical protein
MEAGVLDCLVSQNAMSLLLARYNNCRMSFRGSLPQGAGHENLEGLSRDDHHGVGWDWTSEHGNLQRW